MAAGLRKYVDTAFPGLIDKVKGTENLTPLSSIPTQDKGGAGMQLMGTQGKLRDRSTKGSDPFSDAEIKQGYRKMGAGLGKK